MSAFITSLLAAIGLMLILEGLLPFAAPERWKQLFKQIMELPPEQIRIGGLASILIGMLILWLAL